MDRRRRTSLAGSPLLIGSITALIVLVAVFLSYNANNGLPFVPTYQLKAELPSGANLVKGNEVRIGGARVGAVSDITVKTLPSGRNVAVVTMKLDQAVKPLPKDSAVLVRPKSVLGLKYIEITRGRSRQGFLDGGTIPLANQHPTQVEFDEVADTFDEPTRAAVETNTLGFGDALAGRGESLNEAIGAFKPLLVNIIPVLRTLRAPDTHLRRFIKAVGRTAALVAPAAEQQADLFVQADRTFAALAEVAPSIRESIRESPAALDQAIRSFPIERPFLQNTENLMRELRPGVRSLKSAAPTLADALRIGTPVLKDTVALDRRLLKVLQSLQAFAEDPLVPEGVQDLTDVVSTLRPTLDFVAPAQTQCNYAADWVRNVSDLLTEGDKEGNWQRFIIIAVPQGQNNEGGPASAPANGPSPNYLHVNPYPNTAAPGQPKECEAANEPYLKGQKVIGNVAGTQSASTDLKP